ncbi:hypothetical protein DFH08DRAFT_815242 [Mycena albidolilacea]|uniref:Uncharacterized protein n=1 Tax=Mycena albidolilacea TaxID=1033008 RepID=A0AAD6ZMY5_9AGAR|nr:hypothetical protein DFH08DRAFT_815242 [Mycena albidolilacea]
MFPNAFLFLPRDLDLGNSAAGKGLLDGDSERGGSYASSILYESVGGTTRPAVAEDRRMMQMIINDRGCRLEAKKARKAKKIVLELGEAVRERKLVLWKGVARTRARAARPHARNLGAFCRREIEDSAERLLQGNGHKERREQGGDIYISPRDILPLDQGLGKRAEAKSSTAEIERKWNEIESVRYRIEGRAKWHADSKSGAALE